MVCYKVFDLPSSVVPIKTISTYVSLCMKCLYISYIFLLLSLAPFFEIHIPYTKYMYVCMNLLRALLHECNMSIFFADISSFFSSSRSLLPLWVKAVITSRFLHLESHISYLLTIWVYLVSIFVEET